MEEFLHPSDDLNEPLPPESQALLDRFKAYAVWHPRLLQVRTQVLDTVWEPADVVFVVVCGPTGAVCAARCQMGADACGCQKWGSRIPVC